MNFSKLSPLVALALLSACNNLKPSGGLTWSPKTPSRNSTNVEPDSQPVVKPGTSVTPAPKPISGGTPQTSPSPVAKPASTPVVKPTPTATPVAAETGNSEAVLTEKYDSAHLKCNLWTRSNKNIVLSTAPNDTLDVDLLAAPKLPKIVTLTGRDDDHGLYVEIKINRIALETTSVSSGDGYTYSLVRSPIIEGTFSGKDSFTKDGELVSMGTFQSDKLLVQENIPNVLYIGAQQRDGSDFYSVNYIECNFETTAKAKFANEWKRDGASSEKDCLLTAASDSDQCLISKK